MSGTATETGWYVYGVVDAGREDVEHELGVVRSDGLAAVVAPVDLEEFGSDTLPRKLEDREWLEELARRHEEVLEQVLAGGPVVPLRFGAVYRRVEDVRALLDERRDELADALARVRGRVELGVKGWLDRARLEAQLARESTSNEAAGAGRAYLERRRTERDVAAEAGALAARAARAAHERLLAVAVAGVANRPQPRELSGRDDQMVLNAAYLVPAGDAALQDALEELNRELASLALSFELTGPWPPYNFVTAGAA